MNYAKAREIDVREIPVIDVAPIFDGPAGERHVGAQLLSTVERVGFFYIRNHGVPADMIEEVLAQSTRFFAAPPALKEQVRMADYHRGFLAIGQATMEGAEKIDLKESYIWGWEVAADDPDVVASRGLIAPNRWPDFQPEMQPTLEAYLVRLNDLGMRLLRAFAAGLDIDHDHFVRRFDKPLSRGAIIHYPPQPADMGATQFGVGPHTDYGCITLLYQDETGGLQVLTRGQEWVAATPIPGTYVVNVGDLLHRWSNDRFISNPHRVVNTSGGVRYSVPVFIDPNWDTLIEPVTRPGEEPRYPPVRCADYIREIYKKSFAYRQG